MTNTETPRSLAFIHTVSALVPVFGELAGRHLQGWAPFNIVDESLLKTTIREGRLSQLTMRRLAGHVWSAVDAGAEAVIVTCSSLGPAVDAVRPLCPVPLVRIDDGMALKALGMGGRIGVLATLSTTLDPTTELLKRRAGEAGRSVDVVSHLCEGAFGLLAAGDTAGHDARVLAGLRAIAARVDVVVLAQASMAGALERAGAHDVTVPILTSPELGIQHCRTVLAAA
jgi:Asp/Glu/hydantoin racemase